MRGELHEGVSLECRCNHEHVVIPAWDPAAALREAAAENGGAATNKNSVPLPQPAADGGKWITFDEWKAKLRELYMDGAGKVNRRTA